MSLPLPDRGNLHDALARVVCSDPVRGVKGGRGGHARLKAEWGESAGGQTGRQRARAGPELWAEASYSQSARACLFPQSVKYHYFCSGPTSVDPICPFPRGRRSARSNATGSRVNLLGLRRVATASSRRKALLEKRPEGPGPRCGA